MAKKEKIKTYHLIVLDKSGSMAGVRGVTISGLNEQLQSARQSQQDFQDQEQIICFVTFNDNVDHTFRWKVSINDVADFVEEDYVPAGRTALNDAICIGINKLRDEIKDELSDRKANVMVTILTDGYENASKQFNRSQAKELVEEVKTTGQWTISFMGCGNDVFDTASNYGIAHANTMSYSSGAEGTTEAFTNMAQSRSLRNAAYSQVYNSNMTQEEKAKAICSLNCGAAFFDLDIPSEETAEKNANKKNGMKK